MSNRIFWKQQLEGASGDHLITVENSAGDHAIGTGLVDASGVQIGTPANPLPVRDPMMEISSGNVTGHATVNKFGRNPDVDTATDPEDVWDVGGIWVPPTQARVHNIASTSTADDAGQAGALTIRVWGLTDWDTAEVSEDIVLNGQTDVATVNSYVIIHRMRVLTGTAGATNVGNITATAVTDGTVTAQITAPFGQTLMAIYGIPSTQTLCVTQWYIDMNRQSGATASADCELRVQEDADTGLSPFVVKHHLGVTSSGNSHVSHKFDPPFRVAGPAMVKAYVENVSANDTDMSAGFDGVLVDN